MVEVKLNGTKYNIPTKVEELTVGQFFKLRKANNIIQEVSALTALDVSEISNFKSVDDLNKISVLLKLLAESVKSGFDGKKLPKRVEVGGKSLVIPSKLKVEPVGAFISVHNILADRHNKNKENGGEPDFTDVIPDVLAHYLYCVYHKDKLYSDEEAEGEEFMSLINEIKFVEAVPIANFFFRRFPHLN